MHQRDIVLLCSELRMFDRVMKTEVTMNIVWVPYSISEAVLAETDRFTSHRNAKTFAIASINDCKISTEEAVQIFESLACLQRTTCSFKKTKSVASQPELSCTYAAFVDGLGYLSQSSKNP